MKQLRMVALTMAAIFAVGSSPLVSGSQAQSSVEEEIIRLDKAAHEALVKGDLAAYESHFADDYTEIRWRGGFYTKEQVMQIDRTPGRKMERYDLTDLKARVYGDMAIITGHYSRKAYSTRPDGQRVEIEAQGLFTDVWVKKQGRWLCVANQDTAIANPADTPVRPLPATAGSPAFTADLSKGQSGVESELLRHERALYDALIKKDFPTYAGYLSDDYAEIRANGRFFNKEQVLQAGKRPGGKIERYDLGELKVRVYGDAAIITGRFARKGTAMSLAGQPFDYDEQGRFTDVWVKKQGRWFCVANQDTFLSQPTASGQAQSSVEEEIRQHLKERYELLIKGETAARESYFSDDYTEIRAGGTFLTKEQLSALYKTPGRKVERYDLDDLKVRVYGDTAVVTGRYSRKGYVTQLTGQKTEFDDQGRFTTVLVKKQGRWQAVAGQDTATPKQSAVAPPQSTAPVQGQSAFPFGVYAAKVEQGTWVMEFKNDGTVTVKLDAFSLAPDITYSVKADQIEISAGTTSAMCSGKGTYKWAFDGKALSFQLVSDPNCQPRQAVMTGNKFIKQ